MGFVEDFDEGFGSLFQEVVSEVHDEGFAFEVVFCDHHCVGEAFGFWLVYVGDVDAVC